MKYQTLALLNSAESRIEKELKFTAVCKNTGKTYQYDLSTKQYVKGHWGIMQVVVWGIYKRRNVEGHLSRVSSIEQLVSFFEFLKQQGVCDVESLDRALLSQFAEWLKRNFRLSYATAASRYRKLTPLFRQMSRHSKVRDDFIPVKNAFPKSETLKSSSTGYNKDELKLILNSAILALRESSDRLEKPYQPQWLGKVAPMDDVAPRFSSTSRRSYWASYDYKVWWWENNCDCLRLNSNALFKIPKGQVFFNRLSPINKGSMKHLNKFYDDIGAGPAYKPQYKNKPCPIKYGTPWKKPEYLRWYWENEMGCKPMSTDEIKENAPEFLRAIKEYHRGRVLEFFQEVGVTRWIKAIDLIPYYLMLLIRTGMNPSTIQRLTIDCLVADPFDSGRMMIDWTKFRSFKKGKTIPVDAKNDTWPVMLIQRVIEVTKSIRQDGQKELWITNSSNKKISRPIAVTTFRKGLGEFAEIYQLKSASGEPLAIKAKEFRPTIAWQEYLRTEDMNYLKVLLGHSKLSTTSDYLRRNKDPVFRARRAVHQEAMFVGMTEPNTDKKALLENVTVTKSEMNTNSVNYHDTVLNHCKDPLHSPVVGQRDGHMCAVDNEVCLGCQNLVITPEDIKKYFCFVTFHDYLLEVGDINENEYSIAINEKRYIWNEYILPKYNPVIIQRLKTESQVSPIPVWDVAEYERV